MAKAVTGRTDAMDEALQFHATAIFIALHILLGKSRLCTLKEEEKEMEDWLEVINCNIEEVTPLLIIQEVPSPLTEVTRIKIRCALRTQVVKLDEERKAVTRTVETCPTFTTVQNMFRHRSVPFFQGISSSRNV